MLGNPHITSPPKPIKVYVISMEERVDVGVVNPERIGASMEQQILYRLLIYFFWIYRNCHGFIASLYWCLMSVCPHSKLFHRSRVVPRTAWVFSDQSTSGLITDLWATQKIPSTL